MISHWKRQSLRLRLTLWYTAVVSGILLALAPVVYALIEHRLHLEFDRQLRIDWNAVEDHLASVPRDPSDTQLGGALAIGFEIWSRSGRRVFRHWPGSSESLMETTPPAMSSEEQFHTIGLADGQELRVIDRPTSLRGEPVVLRIVRDESGFHRVLREILISFALGVPVAAALSAFGGFVMAGRLLSPIGAMAEQARQISSESLNQRLPNPNPGDELGQLASVFNETLERLQYSFETLKRFTGDASHELRTPLTALRAVGEVGLRNGAEAGSLREAIASMLEEAQSMQDLVESLLALARIDSGALRGRGDLKPVCLDTLLAEACDSIEILAAEKGQILRRAVRTGVVALADRPLLRLSVLNILHNAIRYSPVEAVLTLECRGENGWAIVEITDTGPGIAPEFHERIFDRFFRIDPARSRDGGGAGLGLAIAKVAIEQQHGRIELDSAPGRGSRFRLVLRRALKNS